MENITFNNVKLFSPVNTQPFIWMVEYFANTGLTEFDLETGKENNFNDIDKTKINRFGLIGKGTKLYFDHFGGTFSLMGQKYAIKLKYKNVIYDLTPYRNNVNDIITYKKAEANLVKKPNEVRHTAHSVITGFFFGYKTKLTIDGINFTMKPIVSLLANKPIFLDLSLSADKDIEGQIIFVKNNTEEFTYDISLRKNITNRSHWNVQ